VAIPASSKSSPISHLRGSARLACANFVGHARFDTQSPSACQTQHDFARSHALKVLILTSVSTLAEIEAAADALPLDEKKKLLQFLESRVNGNRETKGPSDLGKFAGTLRLPEDPLAWQQRVRGEWE